MVLLNVTFVFVNTSNKFGSIPGTVCHTPSSTIYKRNAFDGGVKSQRKEQCKVSLHILMIQDVLPQFTFKTLDFGFQSKMSFNELKFQKSMRLVWLQMIIKVMLVPNLLLRERDSEYSKGLEMEQIHHFQLDIPQEHVHIPPCPVFPTCSLLFSQFSHELLEFVRQWASFISLRVKLCVDVCVMFMLTPHFHKFQKHCSSSHFCVYVDW